MRNAEMVSTGGQALNGEGIKEERQGEKKKPLRPVYRKQQGVSSRWGWGEGRNSLKFRWIFKKEGHPARVA